MKKGLIRFFGMTLSIALLISIFLLAGNAAAQNSPPIVDAGPDQSIFVGEATLLQGSATDPDNNTILDWLWTIEAAPTGSSPYLSDTVVPDPIFEPDVAGDYLLSLIAYDGLVWSASDFVTISAVDILPPVAVADADVTFGVAPLAVSFDGSQSYDPQGGALTYMWNFGDGSASFFEVSPVHMYEAPGVYDATVTVQDVRGQIDSDTIRITVTEPGVNTPPIANAGPDQTIFVDQPTVLQGSATDPDGDDIVEWQWAVDSSPVGSDPIIEEPWTPDALFSANVSGDYVLSLIARDSTDWGLPDTVTIHVVEVLPPVAVAEADVISGPAPLTVTFDGSQSYDPQGGQLNYGWTFDDGSPGSSEVSPIHEYILPGTYTAQLTVVDSRGQFDYDMIKITVLPRFVTQPASDSGRYSTAGFHNPEDTDYAAVVGGTRSFFVFDLTSITDQWPIVSATLTLDTGTVSGGAFGGITYTLYDVTTPVATLIAGGDELTVIYDDLGSGVPYSAATAIEPGTSNSEISIPLLAAGVTAVEAAKGGLIAIGGGPTGLGGNFAFDGTDVSGAVLTIELSNPAIPTVSDFAAAYGCIFPDSNYAEFSDFDDDGDVDGNDLAEFTASFE